MKWNVILNDNADAQLSRIKKDKSKVKLLKSISRTLLLMESNLRHPSLNTHIFHSLCGPDGEKVFESYVQQNTPGAYRIFWYYGPNEKQITITAIIPHPNH